MLTYSMCLENIAKFFFPYACTAYSMFRMVGLVKGGGETNQRHLDLSSPSSRNVKMFFFCLGLWLLWMRVLMKVCWQVRRSFDKFVKTNERLFSNESGYYGNKGDVRMHMFSIQFKLQTSLKFLCKLQPFLVEPWNFRAICNHF